MSTSLSTAALSRRLLLQGAGAIGLAGCSNLIGPPPSPQIYVLRPAFTPMAATTTASWQLVIAVPTAPESLDTERIALERPPAAMDYYANSQWADRVPLLLQSLLVEAFEKSGRINGVGRETAGIRPDYILQADIRDFSAHYAVIDSPPKIRISIAAKLVEAAGGQVVSGAAFDEEAPAAANNMVSITAAFTQAVGAAVSRIVDWTFQLRVPQPAR